MSNEIITAQPRILKKGVFNVQYKTYSADSVMHTTVSIIYGISPKAFIPFL